MDDCAAGPENAAAALGCNGPVPGPQDAGALGGTCSPTVTCADPSAVCYDGESGGSGLCLEECDASDSYVSTGGCPSGHRCITLAADEAYCFPDCSEDSDCSSDNCSSDSVCDLPAEGGGAGGAGPGGAGGAAGMGQGGEAGLPTTSLPVVSLPTISLPTISLPTISLPVSSLPTISLPVSALPVSSLPTISLPMTSLPMISLPVTSLPFTF